MIEVKDYAPALKKSFIKKKKRKHGRYPIDVISQVRNKLNAKMP